MQHRADIAYWITTCFLLEAVGTASALQLDRFAKFDIPRSTTGASDDEVASTQKHVAARRLLGRALEADASSNDLSIATYAGHYREAFAQRQMVYFSHVSRSAGTFACNCGLLSGCRGAVGGREGSLPAIAGDNCHVNGSWVRPGVPDGPMDYPQWNTTGHFDYPLRVPSQRYTSCTGMANFFSSHSITLEANENYLPTGGTCHQFWNVIIVRDPLERLLSHLDLLHLWRNAAADPRRLTVDSLNAAFPLLSNNYYIRSLLGRDVYMLPHGAITEQHLEQAKRVLQSFDTVLVKREGTMGNALLQQQLHHALGWSCVSWPEPVAHKVVSQDTDTYAMALKKAWTEYDWQRLHQQNALDMKLKEYAERLEHLDLQVLEHRMFQLVSSRLPMSDRCGYLGK